VIDVDFLLRQWPVIVLHEGWVRPTRWKNWSLCSRVWKNSINIHGIDHSWPNDDCEVLCLIGNDVTLCFCRSPMKQSRRQWARQPVSRITCLQDGNLLLSTYSFKSYSSDHLVMVEPSRMVNVSDGLPLLIFPCTIKSRSSLLLLAHPGGPGKLAVRWWWWWW